MLEFLSSLFDSKDFSALQKSFIKSFFLSFPLFYMQKASTEAKFLEYDIISKVMAVSADAIMTFTCSIIFLFFLCRLEKTKLRDSLYFFFAPVFLQVNGFQPLSSFAVSFLPFFCYAVLMRALRFFDKNRI